MSTEAKVSARERRDELIAKSREVAEKAQAEGRDLTEDEHKLVTESLVEVKSLNDQLLGEQRTRNIMSSLDAMAATAPAPPAPPGGGLQAHSLGEHFVKHAHPRMIDTKGQGGITIAVPEYQVKAAADPHQVTGWTAGVPYLTEYDRTVVQALRIRLTVADLLGKGTLSGNAISYLVEGAMEGDFTTVAEGAVKPQVHFVSPTAVVDALSKIAAFITLTDEFIEDADFLVSEINNRLLYQLGYFEEQQLLNGNGTAPNVRGLLNRVGIQTETAANPTDNADAVFRAITNISVNSGYPADGIVINPADYQKFRLMRDANEQYYGGGFFQGQYGQGGVIENPPLWGLRTVVTPAIAPLTALVGSFSMCATLYRKGGVRVESTNSHASQFISNLLTIRAEERVALAVRVPLGFAKTTLDWTP